ncbi:MAG: ABC transporter substrate-binding protein [Terriglobia bacterium]
MRHFACRFLAVSSIACLAAALGAATRPRYGGTLRLEIQAKPSTFDAADSTDVADAEAVLKLREFIYDRLVRLDQQGKPEAGIALSWEHDEQAVKWRFNLRPGVKWQDGAPLTPEEVATSLKGLENGASIRLSGDILEIDAGGPSPGLLTTLATNANLTIRRAEEPAGALPIGTGPFRLANWESGRSGLLQANEDYWEGRPFVDTIEIQMGRASRDELLDLELGKADVVELDPVEAHRAQQEGKKVWTSVPVELLCLRFDPDSPRVQDLRVRRALAESIDRTAIQKVLLQNYGEVAGGIFPQWLSGYAFLFSTTMNLGQARQVMAQAGAAPTLKLGYDPNDMLARQTAERVAVNARDAGITLQVVPLLEGGKRTTDPKVDLRVERLRIDGLVLNKGSEGVAKGLQLVTIAPSQPEQAYAAERQFVDSLAVIPLIHIPELLGIGPRVRNWSATARGAWRLERLSLEEEKP